MTEEEFERAKALERFRTEEQMRVEHYKAELETQRLGYSEEQAWLRDQQVVVLQGVMDFALFTLRTLLLVNGGALIALLALISAAWGFHADQGGALAAELYLALGAFGAALVCCILASFGAYIAQVIFSQAKLTPATPALPISAQLFRAAAIGAGVASLGAFGFGVVETALVLGPKVG